MKRILADVVAFSKQFIRSRVGAFFAFAFPVILILLFGAIFSGDDTSKVPLYVQDLDDTPVSREFIAALNQTGVLEYRGIPQSVVIKDYISANSIDTALRILAGFQDRVGRNETVNVTLFGDPTQSSYGIALAAVSGAATQFNFQLAQARPIVGMDRESISVRTLKFIDLFLPGVIGFTVLTTPLFGMTNVAAEYRTRKYFKFLATTKLTKAEWLASKIIFNAMIMYISVALILVTNWVVFAGSAIITPMALLLILAGTIQFTSLGMILGIYVRDTETANAVANAVGFPMMFLAGSFFPLDVMPPAIQSIARVLPLTYVNEGLRATMVFGNEGLAFTYFLITLGLAVVFFMIPARALSWKSK